MRHLHSVSGVGPSRNPDYAKGKGPLDLTLGYDEPGEPRFFFWGRMSFGRIQRNRRRILAIALARRNWLAGKTRLPLRAIHGRSHRFTGSGRACHAVHQGQQCPALERLQQISRCRSFRLLANDLVVMRGNEDPWRHCAPSRDPPVQLQS